MRRIFISDLHLEDPLSPSFQRFAECLSVEAPRVDEIYILGDLAEMWIGDDDDSNSAQALSACLKQAANVCDVFLMHGNRDFLFGDKFLKDIGVTLLREPHALDTEVEGLTSTLLCHGDSLCTDDVDYQNLRTMLRSEAWQADILSKTLDERKALGQAMRAQSQATNANKATNIMDVNLQATTELLQLNNCQRLIHGHTHRPGIHKLPLDHQDTAAIRIVTGAWEIVGWLARQNNDQISLEGFSLARRYEI